MSLEELYSMLKDNDNKLVYLILRLDEKLSDVYQDVNKILTLSKVSSLQTESDKEKLIELFSKLFEAKNLTNKLVCP